MELVVDKLVNQLVSAWVVDKQVNNKDTDGSLNKHITKPTVYNSATG